MELLVPFVLAHIIDQILPQNNLSGLGIWLGILLSFGLVGVLVALLAQYYAAKASVGFANQVNQALFAHISQLSPQTRNKLSKSALASRLTADNLQVQTGLNLFLRLFLRAPIIVFGAMGMAFLISTRLTLIFLVMIVSLFMIVIGISRLSNPAYADLRQLQEGLMSQTDQQLSGFATIRAFDQTNLELSSFATSNQAYKHQALKVAKLANLINPATYLVVNLALMTLLWQGRIGFVSGRLTAGSLIALVNYLLQILQELLKLATMLTNLNQALVSSRRISGIFSLEKENLDALVSGNVGDSLGFTLKHVSLSYQDGEEPALADLTLNLSLGKLTGVVGATGSGKTSFINLLAGLWQPSQGVIEPHFPDKNALSLKDWRQQVSLVSQDKQLLSGSIRQHLTLGMAKEVSDEQLWWALDLAQAKDFISQRPGQLDATIEPFGRNFSGGQRQRLHLARAILQNRPLMILDDATSALDYVTEGQILAAIAEQLPNTRVIMVSQRLKTLQEADQILVLDKGNLVGQGHHEDLLSNCPTYRDLYQSQAREKVQL